MSLDAPPHKYEDYFNKVRQQIKEKWIYPREAADRNVGGQLLIEFHIAKDGQLSCIELRQSSGVAVLDEAAMTAVQAASPFPIVPDSLARVVLPISGRFRYEITSPPARQP